MGTRRWAGAAALGVFLRDELGCCCCCCCFRSDNPFFFLVLVGTFLFFEFDDAGGDLSGEVDNVAMFFPAPVRCLSVPAPVVLGGAFSSGGVMPVMDSARPPGSRNCDGLRAEPGERDDWLRGKKISGRKKGVSDAPEEHKSGPSFLSSFLPSPSVLPPLSLVGMYSGRREAADANGG